MKLYLTLENDNGVKVERVMIINQDDPEYHVDVIVEDMIDSFIDSEKPL